jgi:RHS repeat-associated protein
MLAATSWTRENATGNQFLYNGGTELNSTTAVYDLFYRNYDPVLGRMHQVDPKADTYAGLTPYNYAFNDPLFWNDPMGDADEPSAAVQEALKREEERNRMQNMYFHTSVQDEVYFKMYNSCPGCWGFDDTPGHYGPSGLSYGGAMSGYAARVGAEGISAAQHQWVEENGGDWERGTNKYGQAGIWLFYSYNEPLSVEERLAFFIETGQVIALNNIVKGAVFVTSEGRGSATSFSFGFAFFFGMSGEWGVVRDDLGNSRNFWTVSANFGLGLDIGINTKVIIPNYGKRFSVDDYEGRGKALTFGVGFVSEGRGGNTLANPTLNPKDFGVSYKERIDSFNPFWGIPSATDVGAIYQMSKTSFFK